MRKIFLPLFLLFFLTAANADFRYRINEDLGTLDWNYGEVSWPVVLQLMEGLTTLDKDAKPEPALAESWKFSADGKSIAFKIRKNAKWSDGVKVCAVHFVDAWLRVRSKELASPFTHYFDDVESASADGCEKLNVKLKSEAPWFPALASHWVFFPARKDLIEKYKATWTEPRNLVVTGPYKLESWKRNQEYVLTRNSEYYGRAAGEEKIRAIVIPDDSTALSLFEAGKIDWMKDIPVLEKARLSTRQEYVTSPTLVGYHLGFLMNEKAQLDRGARCALSLALDRKSIAKLLSGGEAAAEGALPEQLLGRNREKKLEYDPALAKKLWAQSKAAKLGALEVFYYSKDIHVPLMEWVQEEWRKTLGVRVKLVRMEGKTYWAKLQNDPPQIFLSGTTATYAHPYAFLSEFLPASPANWGHYASDKYVELALKKPLTAEKTLIHDDCAISPLYFRATAMLVAKKWRGFEQNAMGYVYLKTLTSAK